MWNEWKSLRYKRDKVLIGMNWVSREKYAFYSRTSVDDKSTWIRVAIHRKNFAGEEIHRRLHFSRRRPTFSFRQNAAKFFRTRKTTSRFTVLTSCAIARWKSRKNLPNIRQTGSSDFLRNVSFIRLRPIGTDWLQSLHFIFPVIEKNSEINSRENVYDSIIVYDRHQKYFQDLNNSKIKVKTNVFFIARATTFLSSVIKFNFGHYNLI